MNDMKKFNVGTVYSMNSWLGDNFGDGNQYSNKDFKCIKRTNTFVTLERMKKISGNIPNIIRTKIKINDKGNEYVFFERKILEA